MAACAFARRSRHDLLPETWTVLSQSFRLNFLAGRGEERKGMTVSSFTDVQKAFVLKQGEDDRPVAEICR